MNFKPKITFAELSDSDADEFDKDFTELHKKLCQLSADENFMYVLLQIVHPFCFFFRTNSEKG